MRRDPRSDPRHGDVLRKGNEERTVVIRFTSRVDCNKRVGCTPIQMCVYGIRMWRKWAQDAAIIIHAAD